MFDIVPWLWLTTWVLPLRSFCIICIYCTIADYTNFLSNKRRGRGERDIPLLIVSIDNRCRSQRINYTSRLFRGFVCSVLKTRAFIKLTKINSPSLRSSLQYICNPLPAFIILLFLRCTHCFFFRRHIFPFSLCVGNISVSRENLLAALALARKVVKIYFNLRTLGTLHCPIEN